LEPSCHPKYAGISYPAKTHPAPAAASQVHPVPLPQPIEGPVGYHGCPKPCYGPYGAKPHGYWPVAGYKGKTPSGTILVLFILLVIISRSFPLAGAKICRK